jgi:hypothetical protein
LRSGPPLSKRVGAELAERRQPAGDDASNRLEDQMVEIRVAVADDTGVHALVRGLAALFDRSSIEFDGERNEVRVRAEWESRV